MYTQAIKQHRDMSERRGKYAGTHEGEYAGTHEGMLKGQTKMGKVVMH